jgi:hypothetical protein
MKQKTALAQALDEPTGDGMSKKEKIKLNHASLQKLLESIRHTCEDEPNCEQVYELLDQYAESELEGGNAKDLMPLVYHHLEVCHDCNEEYDLLLSMLRAKSDMRPERSPD